MVVREPYSLFSQGRQRGGADLAAIGGNIGIPQVVCENKNDIGARRESRWRIAGSIHLVASQHRRYDKTP